MGNCGFKLRIADAGDRLCWSRAVSSAVVAHCRYRGINAVDNGTRWLLVVVWIPLGFVANAFRVSGTGVLANCWGSQAAGGFYHTFSGWLIFVVAFLLLLSCGGLLSKIGQGRKEAAQGRNA